MGRYGAGVEYRWELVSKLSVWSLVCFRALRRLGFDELFPIRAEAIAPLLEGETSWGRLTRGLGRPSPMPCPCSRR